jgi:hypothetical protein
MPNERSPKIGITRRTALAGAVAVGATLAGTSTREDSAASRQRTGVCVLTPKAEEGPFYFDPKLVRADITEGKQGAPLALTLQVVAAKDW